MLHVDAAVSCDSWLVGRHELPPQVAAPAVSCTATPSPVMFGHVADIACLLDSTVLGVLVCSAYLKACSNPAGPGQSQARARPFQFHVS